MFARVHFPYLVIVFVSHDQDNVEVALFRNVVAFLDQILGPAILGNILVTSSLRSCDRFGGLRRFMVIIHMSTF